MKWSCLDDKSSESVWVQLASKMMLSPSVCDVCFDATRRLPPCLTSFKLFSSNRQLRTAQPLQSLHTILLIDRLAESESSLCRRQSSIEVHIDHDRIEIWQELVLT